MTEERRHPQLSVILFDLGGVLLKLRDFRASFGIDADDEQFLRDWLLSPAVREFERGAIDFDEFSRRAVAEMRLPYDRQAFLERFNRWPERLFDDVPRLLEALSRRFRCAILSNTNAVHWSRSDIAGVLEPLIDHAFLSFRSGLLKPDRESFEQVAEHYACAADRILFLDDNPLNVEAASATGMRAGLARGTDDVREVLRSHGILPP